MGLKSLWGVVPIRKLADIMAKLQFIEKINIIENFSITRTTTIKDLKRINDLRNSFVHERKVSDKSFRYKDKSIFQNETIFELIEDYKRIIGELSNKVESGKKV